MRKGFTMIELIFVIVILGILAAVALPKFVGVSEQAQLGKAKAFVGSLNRTVAPAIWSESISDGQNGDVTGYGLLDQLKPLDGFFTTSSGGTTDMTEAEYNASLASCTAAGAAIIYIKADAVPGNWQINCKNGTVSEAPEFNLSK